MSTSSLVNSKLLRFILAGAILLISFYPFLSRQAQSASLTALSDTMSRQKVSENANHTIQFDLVSAWSATETVVVDFDNGFTSTGFANTEAEDFDITWEGAEKTIVANGACAADSIEITTVDDTNDVFTFTLCAGSTASAGTDTVVIEIGLHASAGGGGNDQIDNPGSTGSKTITITGPSPDSGSLAVPILTDDQVTVSASVDPTVTSALSATTCSLGTLTQTTIGFCSYTNTVSTNASSGYQSTIIENGNLCSPSVAVCTNSITDSVDEGPGNVDVDQGSSEYGVSSNDAVGAQDIIDSTGCDDSGTTEDASPITGSSQVYADSGDGDAGPVSSAITTVCHSGSVTGSQAAGTYSHIVTHITTATF